MRLQLTKWGNSLAVRLPKNVLDTVKMREGDILELQVVDDGSLIIKPAAKKYDLADLVAGITAENRHSETDWGNPAGGEEW